MPKLTYGKNPSGEPTAISVDADGSINTVSSGGGGASQVEGVDVYGNPITAKPVTLGYMNSSGGVAQWEDIYGSGSPVSSVHGARAVGQNVTNFPVVVGYKDNLGKIKTWEDANGNGAPPVYIVDGSLYISGTTRAAGSFDVTQSDVTTSSALLFTGGSNTTSVTIQNLDATNPIYIKNSAVSSTTGYRIAAGQSFTLDSQMVTSVSTTIYAISTGGTVRVAVLRQSTA